MLCWQDFGLSSPKGYLKNSRCIHASLTKQADGTGSNPVRSMSTLLLMLLLYEQRGDDRSMANVHNYEGRLKKTEKKLFGEQSVLLKEDQEDLQRFYTQIMATGMTSGRMLKILYTLNTMAKLLEMPFRNATKDDFVRLIAKVESSEWSDWTKRDMKIIVRMFVKFIKGTEGYPDEVKWIKAKDSTKTKLPDDILTEDEIKKLAQNTNNSRDKAFILAIYETGTRIGEFLSVKIKNLIFDQYGTIFRVSGKTGDRRIRIVASTPAIKDWIDDHPHKNNPEAYLWVRSNSTTHNKHLTYEMVLSMLHRCAEKANITKPVNPHAFRHARATFLANKFTDRQMKEFFGWRKSETINTYAHLSGRDIDDAVLKQYGIITSTNGSASVIAPKACLRCGEINDPTSKLCKKCYQPMQIDERQQQLNELVLEMLLKIADRYPDTKQIAAELIKQKGLQEMFK